MRKSAHSKPHGQIRRGQLITTFGPGAMLELPNHSVLVSGLDNWTAGGEEIIEPRLVEKVKALLDLPALKLFSPPPDGQDPTGPQTGIAAWQFPEWFITQDVETTKDGSDVRSRMLIHRTSLSRGKFIDLDRNKRSVVPVRFVRACRRGHIGDIDWYDFVHREKKPCRRQLWLDERGTSGDLSEVWVRCECKDERPMSDAALMQTKSLGPCDGSRPWLGPWTKEPCGEPSRLLIRTASNAYFPQLMTVISLPDRDEVVAKAVDQVWEHYVQSVDTIEDLQYERKKKQAVKAALEGLTDDEVLAEIQKRKTGVSGSDKSVKRAELETLISCEQEIGSDKPDGDFLARSLPSEKWDKPWMRPIERVVLVHRLREVVAQVGFTRFEAESPDASGELEMGVTRAALARELTWVPATENKGEGIFLLFKKDLIEAWLGKPAVQARGRKLAAGFDSWLREHSASRRKFPTLPYIMLHSFSHMLITAVALECGYPASSIRERIYREPDVGYGILLHTGTSDAEGTLGGLVEVGRNIHHHIRNALEMGELCSNDPVCAQHEPSNHHERRFLHGAACHGCLLIAETSCEQHNEFLDRASVVPTIENLGTEFFDAALS